MGMDIEFDCVTRIVPYVHQRKTPTDDNICESTLSSFFLFHLFNISPKSSLSLVLLIKLQFLSLQTPDCFEKQAT